MTSPSPSDHTGDHPPSPDEASLLQGLLEEQKQLADSMNRHYQRLEEQVLDLSHALDNIGGYVFMKDRQGRYTYANRLVRELFGHEHDEIIGRDDSAFFSADTVEEIYRHDRQVFEEGRTISGEERLSPNSRQETLVYWTVKMPLFDAEGRVRGLCGISTDITARIRMEETLRSNQTLLTTVLDNIGACIYMKSPDGRYLYANRATGQLLGIQPEKLIGFTDESLFPAEVAQQFRLMDQQALTHGGKVEGMECIHLQDRETQYFWSVKMPLLTENQNVYAVLGMSTDMTERKRLEDELLRLATTDDLTRLSNRRHFLEQAETTLSRSRRYSEPLALLMCDIDFFKNINDTFGHAVGDQALCRVAEIIRGSLRDTDLAGRIGGEEFAIMLVQTSLENAHEVADRLRQTIEAAPILLDDGQHIQLTISIGVATPAYPMETLATLLQHADQALYAAKRQGRNRVCMA